MDELTSTLHSRGIIASSLQTLRTGRDTHIYVHRSTGEAAVNVWQALRALVDETGYWPVLLGTDMYLTFLTYDPSYGKLGTATEILDAAQALDVAGW